MSNALKWAAIILTATIIILVVWIVYRLFFQFNQSVIKIYAKEAAQNYSNPSLAYQLIMESAEEILMSHNKTQFVLALAKANKSGKEQELINAAVNQSINLGGLPPERIAA